MNPRSRMLRAVLTLLAVAAVTAGVAIPRAGAQPAPQRETAIFAGGCFWCEEAVFDAVPGVLSVTSGYTGGSKDNPTYEQVETGATGHIESVEVAFDPDKVSYERLLDLFWRNVDPLTPDAQFCDHGSQYRSAIFYSSETQKRLADASKAVLEASHRFNRPIVTEIAPAAKFWPAEEYHQHYHVKNPLRYRYYRFGCGRDRRLEELWGAPPPSL
jgi:peptide-methionine (S)-S-oxide reductase